MLKYVIKRFIQMVVVLFVVSVVVFCLTNFIGDPVDMLVPENATMEQIESARARLGLDKPLPVQYMIFLKDVLHGNFGKSYTYGKPAMGLIIERIPATLELVAVAALLVVLIAIPLGVYAGAYPKRRSSKVIMSASILRLTRAGILENMKQDYIKFARAKGVTSKALLFGHALKNALIPVITIFGMDLGNMIAFTTITETIFAWPGMGKLLIDAINKSDRPIIVAYLMAAACMFVVLNFVVDMLYTLIDPRIELR